MPEVLFTIQLPNGTQHECYSPSSVIKRYFTRGEELPVSEFVERSRAALAEASERVRAKFGFACSSAALQLEQIETWTRDLPGSDAVRIVEI